MDDLSIYLEQMVIFHHYIKIPEGEGNHLKYALFVYLQVSGGEWGRSFSCLSFRLEKQWNY